MADSIEPRRWNLWSEASLFLGLVPIAAMLGAGWDLILDFPELPWVFLVCPLLAVTFGWIGRRRALDGPKEARVVANLGIFFAFGSLFCCFANPHSTGSYGGRYLARRAQSMNNLRQIALALQSYHEANGRFPPAVIRDGRGRPLYSWRVAILPYLESAPLHDEFHLDEPWDSPHNRGLLGRMPWVYRSPFSQRPAPSSETSYQAVVGPGTAFDNPLGARLGPGLGLARGDANPPALGEFPDGAESTLFLVAARRAVPWSQPVDFEADPGRPLPPLGEAGTARKSLLGRETVPGFLGAFADARVRYFDIGTPESTLRAFFSRAGGDPVPRQDY